MDGESSMCDARVRRQRAGPWVDAVRRLEDPRAGTSVRLSKGARPRPGRERLDRGTHRPTGRCRVTFAVPWYGMLCSGRPTRIRGRSRTVAVEPADVAQILDEAARRCGGTLLEPEAVRPRCRSSRAPSRGPGTASAAARDRLLDRPRGMLSVAGGKLTTYRRIALEALDRVGPSAPTSTTPLACCRGPRSAPRFPIEPIPRSGPLRHTSTAVARRRWSSPRRRTRRCSSACTRTGRHRRAGPLRGHGRVGPQRLRTCSGVGDGDAAGPRGLERRRTGPAPARQGARGLGPGANQRPPAPPWRCRRSRCSGRGCPEGDPDLVIVEPGSPRRGARLTR